MHTKVNFEALLEQISQRLDPNGIAIDGRDVRDRLAFMSQLAELVVFFDERNQAVGTWYPMLMKDPVILLAVISKTDYQPLYVRFQQISKYLGQSQVKASLSQQKGDLSPALKHELQLCLVPVFDLLDQMFQKIDGWVANMSQSDVSYHLKQFVLGHASQRVSTQLQQRTLIQNKLARLLPDVVTACDPAFSSRFTHLASLPRQYDSDNDLLWAGTPDKFLEALERLFQQVFSFFMEVISSAERSFYEQYQEQHDYPDTALLRVFVRLLEYSQAGLNEFSSKHLDFYYGRVLEQKEQGAEPDTTYLRIDLDKAKTSFTLDSGTGFVAGTYSDTSQIIFSTLENSEINRVALGQLITSNYLPLSSAAATDSPPAREASAGSDSSQTPTAKAWQQSIDYLSAVDQIRYQASGQMQPQAILSGAPLTPVAQGFAIASPMLALQAGQRQLVLTLTLDQTMDVALLQQSSIALSTAKAWQPVSQSLWQQGTSSQNDSDSQSGTDGNSRMDDNSTGVSEATSTDKQAAVYQLRLTLPEDFPAVSAFHHAPPGFTTSLPYCRIVLPNAVDLQQIPRLLALQIDVQVYASPQVVLRFGGALLSSDKPMSILGSTPELGGDTCVRCAEAFAKPLTTLDISFFWDDLPKQNFTDYYDTYNTYLTSLGQQSAAFSNQAFTVDWQLSTSMGWQPISATLSSVAPKPADPKQDNSATNAAASSKKSGLFSWLRGKKSATPAQITQPPNGLFAQQSGAQQDSEENAPVSNFHFTLESFSPVAAGSTDLRMTLTGPAYAFGHPIYPALVADISLKNAQKLIAEASLLGLMGLLIKLISGMAKIVQTVIDWLKKLLPFINVKKTKKRYLGELIPMPNLPYVPKLKAVHLAYSAQQHYDFSHPSKAAGGEDVALVHIGAFSTYRYYEVANGVVTANLSAMRLQPEASLNQPGLALYEGVSKTRCALFLQLFDVAPPCRVNIFVQLALNPEETQTAAQLSLYYWGEQGWTLAEVISDGTKGLLCSGIVSLSLAQDMLINPSRFSAQTHAPEGADSKANNAAWLMLTQVEGRTVDVVYVNTQVVKVQRNTPIPLPVGQRPELAAAAIQAPLLVTPAIAKVTQPFASMGGVAAEDETTFRNRVAQRIRSKDRLMNGLDYTVLAQQAYADAYYVKALPSSNSGRVRLGLVRSYAAITDVNALSPVVGASERDAIYSYLMSRGSAMAQIQVENMGHEAVQVSATLMVSQSTNINALKAALIQGINLYLAPWVKADQPQYDITRGVSQAGLSSYLASFAQVQAIQTLHLEKLSVKAHGALDETDVPVLNDEDDWLIPSKESQILVPARTHVLSFVRVLDQTQEALYG